jgi:protein-S-isoprenylcysteine O-methyltransferase Ste14
MSRVLVDAGNAVCWSAVTVVWVVGALYNTAHAPRRRTRSRFGAAELIAVVVVAAMVGVIARGHWDGLEVGVSWFRILGLTVLVASTVFTLWARLSLGSMWNLAPTVKEDHQLRTRGPYAVTRHPIYTGLLGMLLGSTLLSGVGQWILLVPVGVVVLEVKIRAEEGLMVATFPDDYPRYRERVPQLVPGLFALRGRHSPSGQC